MVYVNLTVISPFIKKSPKNVESHLKNRKIHVVLQCIVIPTATELLHGGRE